MAIFASVVKNESFSGAAKELNITTSAVSQQIRSLESNLGVVLLQRSTRKINLTEAGKIMYKAALGMVKAAELGWHEIDLLHDEIMGRLTIVTTPSLAYHHLIPALSEWLNDNTNLSLHLITQEEYFDSPDDNTDIVISMTPDIREHSDKDNILLTQVPQMLLASPNYLATHDSIRNITDLNHHQFIGTDKELIIDFIDHPSLKINSHLSTDNPVLALNLATSDYGIVKTNALDAELYLKKHELLPVLHQFELPKYHLIAQIKKKDLQPIKIQRCLDILVNYFKTY